MSKPPAPQFELLEQLEMKQYGLNNWRAGYYPLERKFEDSEWWYTIVRTYVVDDWREKHTMLSCPSIWPEWCFRRPEKPEKFVYYGGSYSKDDFIQSYGRSLIRAMPPTKASPEFLEGLR